jgi:phosphoglucosamine mutase
MSEKHIFGTDGIRGLAGEFPLTKEIIYLTTKHLSEYMKLKKVLIADDSRKSSSWIKTVLFNGLNDSGIEGIDIGTISTPALAKIVALSNEYDGGIMISASHNPAEFNGIKFLNKDGMKLGDKIEFDMEKKILKELNNFKYKEKNIIKTEDYSQREIYEKFVFSNFLINGKSKKGEKIIIDCSNGATSTIAYNIFSTLGYDTKMINCKPTGLNINKNCGSLYPENLAEKVRENNAFAGIAFDGDGDRVIMIDEKGDILDGDILLYFLLKHYHKNGYKLPLIGTVMSNLALEKKAKEMNIEFIRASVGDKYVWEQMIKTGSLIGGETSGHIILRDYHTTGDGILVALKILEIFKESNSTLSEIAKEIELYPQILENIKIKRKIPLDDFKEIKELEKEIKDTFNGEARIIIRYSGTEPLLRIMVEAKDKNKIRNLLNKYIKKIKEHL